MKPVHTIMLSRGTGGVMSPEARLTRVGLRHGEGALDVTRASTRPKSMLPKPGRKGAPS